MLGAPGSSHETPEGLVVVLLDVLLDVGVVLLDVGVVLLDKICVVGILRCLSLTPRSRHRRQDHADGMSPLVTL